MDKKINLMVVEDHPIYRKAVLSIFRSKTFIERIYEAEDGVDCLAKLKTVFVDVVLLDINMPHIGGVDCLKLIKSSWPTVKVILLTQFGDAKFYRVLMGLGASGYILKSASETEILSSFKEIVFQDKIIVSPEVETDMTVYDEKGGRELLRPREAEILALICQEMSSLEISERLQISIHTVSNHRKSILKKIGATNKTALIKWAVKHDMF
jgi:DNA-binding NarL/FixJ family response regulator